MTINLCNIKIQTAVVIIGGAGYLINTLEWPWGGWFDDVGESFHDGGQSVAGSVGQRVPPVGCDSVSHGHHVLVVVRVVGLTDHVLY